MLGMKKLVQVGIHKLGNKVNIGKSVIVFGFVNVEYSENVFMFHLPQQADFANDAFSISQVLKHRSDLLDSHFSAMNGVGNLTYNAVRSMTQSFAVRVSRVDTKRVSMCKKESFLRNGSGGRKARGEVCHDGVLVHVVCEGVVRAWTTVENVGDALPLVKNPFLEVLVLHALLSKRWGKTARCETNAKAQQHSGMNGDRNTQLTPS